MEGNRILVWDLPTRLFHWLLAGTFGLAFVTAEQGQWRVLHIALGYGFMALLAFRVAWGLIGTRYARFASFAFGLRAVLSYLRSLVVGRPEHHVGHNPAGAWAIYAMLVLAIGVGVSGLAAAYPSASEWTEDLHEFLASAMLAIVAVHVLGVVVGSLLHRENLVASMLTGIKRGNSTEAIATPRRLVGGVLAILVGVAVVTAVTMPETIPGGTVAKAKIDAHHARHAAGDGAGDDD